MSERVIWLMKFGIHHIPQSHTHQRRLQRKKVTTPKIWVIICASSHAIWRRRGLTQRYGMRHGVHEGVFAGRGAFLLGKRVQTVRVRYLYSPPKGQGGILLDWYSLYPPSKEKSPSAGRCSEYPPAGEIFLGRPKQPVLVSQGEFVLARQRQSNGSLVCN
ncbi:hypothetical protein PCASD_02988 [Puccinia coronata f. sp. avenae]|uniref:Uncharacterized protein n=1 Tax=Puccinia coronata f. sp. avenae TaxID=200324 RepID=A0A2N5VGM8_9BASI|nr:hypothetical protein PCASD_13282 [Puccinia coronata f. sp. avenae]PLW49165.1 hypothetical protein PCASD_02988 [Puccinia coronata f. sp. avenae]